LKSISSENSKKFTFKMAFKFVLLFATLAAVNAGVLQPAGVYQQTAAIYPQQTAAYFPQQTTTIVKQPAYNAGWQQPQHGWQQQAAIVQPAATIYKQPAIVKQVAYAAEAPANYEFNYDVHDTHTGDIKQQNEKAINGVITGQYSLIEPDGNRRIVDYTADDIHGFQANVRREPAGVKVVQPAIAVQKVIAQPAYAVQKVIAQPAYNAGWQQPQQSYNAGWQQQPAKLIQSNPWG
jgi:lipopolysaccharide export LptBFGC system permease protein LptF